MAESIVQVAPDSSGKKLHTWQTTIGANAVEDEFTLPAEFPYPSYIASASAISIATAGDDILQIMAGASLKVRIRRIYIEQVSAATTAALGIFAITRVTTAGTGGGAVTPAKLDNADAAAGATAASAVPNASHGTAGVELFRKSIWLVQTVPVGGIGGIWTEWDQLTNSKPIVIPTGVTNGLVIRNVVARAAATVNVFVEFVETAF